MELYSITCSLRGCLCFRFPLKITHPAFILRTSLSSLESYRTEVFSKCLAQGSKSLWRHLSWITLLGSGHGHWPTLLLDSGHSKPESLSFVLSPDLVIMLFC